MDNTAICWFSKIVILILLLQFDLGFAHHYFRTIKTNRKTTVEDGGPRIMKMASNVERTHV